MSARDTILGRIRSALGRNGPLTEAQSAVLRDRLATHPRGPAPTMDWEPVARFRERCLSLSSTVDEIASLPELPGAVARYLRDNGLPMAASGWPQFGGLDWAATGVNMQARPAQGDDKVGLTGVFCGIAETGTLMLLSGANTDARNSLLPDTHIAVVPASRIVRSLEDGWALLRKEHGDLPRQVAFVSGPSRTADIELTLVLGIHGPYRVHIILLRD
jgi:L-lactate dehydrogenase complex protein LldG